MSDEMSEEVKEERLHDFEKETIIVFNKEEAEASIFTYEKRWQAHLEKNLGLKPIFDNGFGAKEYLIDKKRIKMPRALKVRKMKVNDEVKDSTKMKRVTKKVSKK
jgi:hypothetical protein